MYNDILIKYPDQTEKLMVAFPDWIPHPEEILTDTKGAWFIVRVDCVGHNSYEVWVEVL